MDRMTPEYRYVVWFRPSGQVLTALLRTRTAALNYIQANGPNSNYEILRLHQELRWVVEGEHRAGT